MAGRIKKHCAVFIDRDGTLIREGHYLHRPEHVRFIKGSIEALKTLKENGFKLVMVTNQSGIGRGYYTLDDMRRVHGRIQDILHRHGAAFDGIYYCPHHPDIKCKCRKPALGMVKAASRALGLDLAGSYVVGDHTNDFIMGQRMGGKGLMVLSGHGAIERREKLLAERINERPDRTFKNLPAAARWILAQMKEGK